jgi:hypothetical protein
VARAPVPAGFVRAFTADNGQTFTAATAVQLFSFTSSGSKFNAGNHVDAAKTWNAAGMTVASMRLDDVSTPSGVNTVTTGGVLVNVGTIYGRTLCGPASDDLILNMGAAISGTVSLVIVDKGGPGVLTVASSGSKTLGGSNTCN